MPNLVNPYRFGSLWTPASLTGVSMWLRADDLNAQADASAVSSWVDRIGSFNFEQSDGAKQPTFYKTTSARLIGGQPTVTLDGTADLLRYAGTIGTPTSGHAFIVTKPTVPGSGTTAIILASDDEVVSSTRFWECCLLGQGSSLARTRYIQRNNDTQDVLEGTSNAVASGTNYVLEWDSTGTAQIQRVNGVTQTVSVTGGANNGDWRGDTSNRDSVVIGCRKTNTEAAFYAGDIAEIILVDNANLSAGERTSLNGYFNSRYGFSL